MDNLIEKLTAEQALEVVRRLSRKGGEIQAMVLTEAKSVLVDIDLDEIADEVFFALDSIDVQDCWDRAGGSRDGYTSPEDAAVEIIEEELEPFFDQAERYYALEMYKQEATYCMGVILGIYRYERESKSEFKDWCVDIPIECAGGLLDDWRKRNKRAAAIEAMDKFVQKRCPSWAKYLVRTKDKA